MTVFSIITVCLNNLDGLKTTAQSIRQQTLSDYEWIVIDGGSMDGTQTFLATTSAQWLSQPDQGIYDAMNKGIERAQGHYILFLNAGDALATEDALKTIQTATYSDPALIYGDSLEQLGDDVPVYKPARTHKALALGLFTHHQAMLYNRKKLGTLRYDTSYKIAADYDLTARMLQTHPNAHYIPAPICIFESGGISQTSAALGRTEQFEIRKKLNLCGPVKNRIITAAQTLIWAFRRAFPNLYWSLKSR